MASMRKREVSAPAGGAGLIRYFDVDEGGPKIDPKVIIGLAATLIILEILAAAIL